jgi:hypothetical protein
MTVMRLIAALALLALAACGADGAPNPPATGLSIGGTAEMGMARDGG